MNNTFAESSTSLCHRASGVSETHSSSDSYRCGCGRRCPTSVCHLHLGPGSSLLSLCGSSGPGPQGSHARVPHSAPWASCGGAASLHSEKMLLLVSVLISLGLRPLLLSVTTIVGLDQFTVFQIPKDTSHVGQETDISPPPPVAPPHVFPSAPILSIHKMSVSCMRRW